MELIIKMVNMYTLIGVSIDGPRMLYTQILYDAENAEKKLKQDIRENTINANPEFPVVVVHGLLPVRDIQKIYANFLNDDQQLSLIKLFADGQDGKEGSDAGIS